MLHNLVPDFLAVLDARDPRAAYREYHERHRPILDAYWRNYVLDPHSAPADEVVRHALAADRRDLLHLLAHADLEALVDDTLAAACARYRLPQPVDVYLIVGVGAANAGELVVDGRGAVVLCVEHFTGRANPDTHGLGLPPSQLTLWLAHELAHVTRYTQPDSASALRPLIAAQGGTWDCWEAARRAPLRELLVNEGLAVLAAEAVAPGFEPWTYLGYPRRHYRRLRELDAQLRRAAHPDLDRAGLGLRLRWLTGGLPANARLVNGRVLPERAGYYLGRRMAEALVQEIGIAAALRAGADEFARAAARVA